MGCTQPLGFRCCMTREQKYNYWRASKILVCLHLIAVIGLTTMIGGLLEFDPSGNFVSAGSNMSDYVISVFFLVIMLIFLLITFLGAITVCCRACICLAALVPITFASGVILFSIGMFEGNISTAVLQVCD